jgi:hypothetical protein
MVLLSKTIKSKNTLNCSRKNIETKIENKEEKQKKLLRENARMEKWNEMLKDFDNYHKKHFEKLKSRTRKGIPDSVRGLIWQIYAEINKYRKDETLQNVYENILNDEASDLNTESVILRDIDRTFPKHTFFKDKYGLG